jgi:carbon monoxide dehydrogenase subunit G
MASITKEVHVNAPVDRVWDAVRDVGNIHKRLVPGFVTDCRMEGDARVVTFANGITVRELIVDLDEKNRRLVWSARGGRLTHHNASLQVMADGATTRITWVADLLPNEMRGAIEGMIEQGMRAMKTALEK